MRRKRNKQRKAKLIEKRGGFCRMCGAKDNLTVDHIKPLSKGGYDKWNNLQLLCVKCNRKKSGK